MEHVTVGIPTLNSPHLLERALKSIADCTKLDGVRVLVCDDGSAPDKLQKNKEIIGLWAQRVPGLEMLVNGSRCGISKSWNRLTRHYGDAQIIVLMNDDIEVVDFWLDVLVYSLRENPLAGMVGLNSYVSLTKQQYAKVFPADALPHERMPLVDYREACLMDGGGTLLSAQGPIFGFRKDAFDLVGGFDERYFVYYEELDFAVSLRKKGLYSFMASYPLCFHQGGATNSIKENIDAAEHMARSGRLFREKWSASIDELREGFRKDYVRPALREWTSQIHNWK
jgi:GT2 family glycosyltransferase